MSRKIVFTAPEAGQKPAVRIVFKGKDLNDYYSLRKIAREDFGVSQTDLGRQIICDFLERYRQAKKAGQDAIVKKMQTALYLED
jgi:hypothetical protein